MPSPPPPDMDKPQITWIIKTQRGAFCNYQPCRRVGTLCGLPGGCVMNFGSLENRWATANSTTESGLKNFAEGRERPQFV
jgi:hypothetical protein